MTRQAASRAAWLGRDQKQSHHRHRRTDQLTSARHQLAAAQKTPDLRQSTTEPLAAASRAERTCAPGCQSEMFTFCDRA